MYRLFFTILLASTTLCYVSSESINCYTCTIGGKTNQEENLKCPADTTTSTTCPDKQVCGQDEKKLPGSLKLGCVAEGEFVSCVDEKTCCKTNLCNREAAVAVPTTTTTQAPTTTQATAAGGTVSASTKGPASGQSPVSYSLSVLMTSVIAITWFVL